MGSSRVSIRTLIGVAFANESSEPFFIDESNIRQRNHSIRSSKPMGPPELGVGTGIRGGLLDTGTLPMNGHL
jgi:hypothetical protein